MKKLITLLVALLNVSIAHAEHCYYQPYYTDPVQEDFYTYKMCTQYSYFPNGKQSFVDEAWSLFDFDKGDWDEGFGFYDVCNSDTPLARTLNAIWILKYTAPVLGPGSPRLGRFYNYSATSIDELDGQCYAPGSSAAAQTHIGSPGSDHFTALFWNFFYDKFGGMVFRPMAIVHEARHADLGYFNDVPHVTENCPSSVCDQSWSGKGAYMYHTLYSLLFYEDAVETTSATRLEAGMLAQWDIDNRFVEHPGFNVIF